MPETPAEWEKLGKLAFRRQEKIGALFRRVNYALTKSKDKSFCDCLRILKQWMLVPLTLWPIDISGLAEHFLKNLKPGYPLDERLSFIFSQLENLPSQEAQDAIAEYERYVEQGNYEPLIREKSKCKYSFHEQELLNNQTLKREWEALKTLFKVEEFRDKKGIIRRRMAQERNFRSDWKFLWNTDKERFLSAFDAFCHRWNLYGVEGDKPLLLKLSVNPTAHGMMIMIPVYWSFDLKRDLDARAIAAIHKSRGALRQGLKMSGGRFERRKQAKEAFEANSQAKKNGLRGERRRRYVIEKLSLSPDFDERTLRRLIKDGADGWSPC